jgi:uncharacterized protein (DUF1697 family)
MMRYVAFLRGMNLGRRRITNDELCQHITALGFSGVSAFLASGNVIFDARQSAEDKVARRLEDGLREALDYEVPTFLRTAAEVRKIAAHQAFDRASGSDGGKLQVAMLARAPTAAARRTVLALSCEADRLALLGRELYWLPRGKLTESELDLRAIEKALGSMTMRTRRTIERIAAKFLAD